MTINLNASWGDHVIGEITDEGDVIAPMGDDTTNGTIKE